MSKQRLTLDDLEIDEIEAGTDALSPSDGLVAAQSATDYTNLCMEFTNCYYQCVTHDPGMCTPPDHTVTWTCDPTDGTFTNCVKTCSE